MDRIRHLPAGVALIVLAVNGRMYRATSDRLTLSERRAARLIAASRVHDGGTSVLLMLREVRAILAA